MLGPLKENNSRSRFAYIASVTRLSLLRFFGLAVARSTGLCCVFCDGSDAGGEGKKLLVMPGP